VNPRKTAIARDFPRAKERAVRERRVAMVVQMPQWPRAPPQWPFAPQRAQFICVRPTGVANARSASAHLTDAQRLSTRYAASDAAGYVRACAAMGFAADAVHVVIGEHFVRRAGGRAGDALVAGVRRH
jgi:hypothetical protein